MMWTSLNAMPVALRPGSPEQWLRMALPIRSWLTPPSSVKSWVSDRRVTMLKLENVSARIDNVEVLRSISVDLPAGSIVAVVGRNGAGKTTLLRAVMGLLDPEAGAFSFHEQALSIE